ncbi:hypothetical protein F7725_012304 [Dissostichus mawsoni]|uniref:Uncharacterized protein n=1 Tax=Dissostichus mawsoni TaxID=36200 RepID=A0A7J5YLY6_DISMA|nr:hypothetical protein F7725_012304 [Dissostichus mawsoni]
MWYRSLVGPGGGEEAQQQREEGGQDLSEGAGGVGHHDLPHMEGGLADHQLGVRAPHVESGEHAVTPLSSQSTDDRLVGGEQVKDFGVADDGANEAQRLLSGLLHLHVGVGQHFGLFLQSHQQRGEDQLHPVGTQFFLSWMPSVSVLMMSCCLRARMPRPFTSPASPYAAPFLSAYLSLSRSSCRRFLTIPAASSLMAGTKGGRQPATDSCTWGGGGEEREDEEWQERERGEEREDEEWSEREEENRERRRRRERG